MTVKLTDKQAAAMADYLAEQMDSLEQCHKDYFRKKVTDVDVLAELRMVRRWIQHLRSAQTQPETQTEKP